MLLNPPPESSAATSGMEAVPPTAVTLWTVPKSVRCEQSRNTWTYYGQVAGKFGMNRVRFFPSFVKHDCVAGSGFPSPAPPSPELNSSEMPRAPSEDR